MTVNFAIEYIPKRVAELCYCFGYHIRLRHFVLQVVESRIIEVKLGFFILIDPSPYIQIESDIGVFNIDNYITKELQYEYHTNMTVRNASEDFIGHVKFIQVIPKLAGHALSKGNAF